MATEDILIRYRADVSQLEADIDKVIKSQEELTAATKANTTETTKAANSAEFAAKKRAQLLQQEEARLVKLRQAQKLAFDPAEIEKFNRKIEESNRRIATLSSTTNKQKNELGGLSAIASSALGGIGAAAAAAFSVDAILNFTKTAVEAFARLESAQVTFQTLVGNAELADKIFAELKEFSIRTPFQAEDVQASAKTLIQFGISTSEVVETVKILGDVSAGTGKNIQELSVIFGQIASTGKLTGQDLLQLINAGFNPLQVISEKTGQSISKLKSEMEKGNITFEQVKDAFKTATSEGGKFFDLTNKLADTTAGQLSTLQDESDQLAASIGQKLAPAFLRVKKDFLEFVNALLTSKADEQVQKTQKRIETLARAVEAEVEGQKQFFEQSVNLQPAEAQLKAIEGVRKRINKEVNLYIGSSTEEGSRRSADLQYELDALNELEAANKQALEDEKKNAEKRAQAEKESAESSRKSRVDEAKKTAEEIKKLLASLDSEILKIQSDLDKRKIEIIPADSQKAQEDRIKALADLEEKSIEDDINEKIKAVQEDEKLSEKQKNQVIAKYEELKKARLELAQFNEQNELNIINAEQVKRIEDAYKKIDDLDLEKALTIEADKVEAANEAVAKSFEDLGEAISKADVETAKQAATARTEELNKALKSEQGIKETQIKNAFETAKQQIKAGDGAAAELEAITKDKNNKIEKLEKDTNDKIAENNAELNNQITTNTERSTKDRIAQTFEVLNATQQLVGELSSLYAQFSEQRISEIEAERDAQLESIEAQLTQNEEYLEQRRISEEEAAAQEKALIAERQKIEEAAQKKIREEKRKQAILDKAAAVFEIGLQTAIAIVSALKEEPPLNFILTALIGATSAAQLAAVAAQPIPYRKGSKDTGAKGHMARVGEEGEEIVYMPGGSKVLPAKQTRRYGDVIDAMFDNRLDDYIYKNYITPALVAQNEKKETARAKNFADNLANSIIYNQPGLTASDLEAQRKRGQYIRNVDELADAIAKRIPTRDIYRA